MTRPGPEPVCNGHPASEVGDLLWADVPESAIAARFGLSDAEILACWSWWVRDRLASGDLAPAGGHDLGPLPAPLAESAPRWEDQ